MKKLALFIFISSCLAYGQAGCTSKPGSFCMSGSWRATGAASYMPVNFAQIVAGGFAQFPQNWVDMHVCDPPGGVYDTTKTIPGDYAATFAGLRQAAVDQEAANSGAGQWMLLKIAAGTNIHGSTYDSNGALISWPTGYTGSKCLVVESSTPNTATTIVCSHGLPGYGGTRNPGCTNDLSKMWTLTIDAVGGGQRGMFWPVGSSHIVVRDMQSTIIQGTVFQSATGVNVSILIDVESTGLGVGVERSYFHGYDPGDSGQPGTTCTGWTMTGNLSTDATGTAVSWVSGKRFGESFSDGTNSPGFPQAQIEIPSGSGNLYTIQTHDPSVSDTALTLVSGPASQTNVTYKLTNPMTKYATGCGDDTRSVQFNCDNCWFAYNYVEKIHWFGSESHSISVGFSNGPYKIVHNWFEAGSCGYFSGGAAVDTAGGPASDGEIRGNIFMRDLDYRFISASSGHSPSPPFGCGPLDHNAAHDNCPINWAIKNNIEMKLGHRLLFDGNIVDGDWADGQSGNPVVISVRTISGGSTGGVYDPVTGLPMTAIDNVRLSNMWIRNAPQVSGMSTRSLGPGNGGGLSLPIQNIDFINSVYSNMGDINQWGRPDTDMFAWTSSSNKFLCNASRTNGKARQSCSPIQLGNLTGQYPYPVIDGGFDVSSAVRTTNTVTIKMNGARHDPQMGGTVVIGIQDWLASTNFSSTQIKPTVGNAGGFIFSTGANVAANKTGSSAPAWSTCQTLASTCVDNAITWTNTGNTTLGVEGSFTITGVLNTNVTTACTQNYLGQTVAPNLASQPQPCLRYIGGVPDGTFADAFTYADARTNLSLCTSKSLCDQSGISILLPNLAFKMVELSVGDGVYAHNCTDSSFNVGATSAKLAISPTTATGLDVYYDQTGLPDTSGGTCQVENGSGLPKNISFQNNAFLSPTYLSIDSSGLAGQHLNNQFFGSIFASTDAGHDDILTCTGIANEGTASFPCWDPASFQFYGNLLQGRSSSFWSTVPLAFTANVSSPPLSTVACAGVLADPSCIGWAGFLNGTAFPNSACSTALAPVSCPLMALPWQTNFNLSMIRMDPSSSYLTFGPNITALENAFTSMQYVCPSAPGICGASGPYRD